MITIIGDTYKELAILQSVINIGILNDNDNDMSGITFDTTYKLSSENLILTDKYGNIIGEKSRTDVLDTVDEVSQIIDKYKVKEEVV